MNVCKGSSCEALQLYNSSFEDDRTPLTEIDCLQLASVIETEQGREVSCGVMAVAIEPKALIDAYKEVI